MGTTRNSTLKALDELIFWYNLIRLIIITKKCLIQSGKLGNCSNFQFLNLIISEPVINSKYAVTIANSFDHCELHDSFQIVLRNKLNRYGETLSLQLN